MKVRRVVAVAAVAVLVGVGAAYTASAATGAGGPVKFLAEPRPVPVAGPVVGLVPVEDEFMAAVQDFYPDTVPNRIGALSAGYGVCWSLDAADGWWQARVFLDGALAAESWPEAYVAVVSAATAHLCPQHEAVAHAWVEGVTL